MNAFLYSYRIMLRWPGDEPIELHRSAERLTPRTLRHFIADLAPEWEVEIQHRLPDRQCITPRVVLNRYTGTEKLKLHLTHEQKEKLYEH